MASNASTLKAVLFDRDGTLVVDVPYNGDPQKVQPCPGARKALDGLRGMGLATGVLSNQSGIARGLLTVEDVNSVNARVEDLLGPFDVWEVCPHGAGDGCLCRKPAPGMIHSACRRLGIDPSEAAFIGDIGSDVEAAAAAGARGVLVPTPHTRAEEVEAAPEVAADLEQAVALLFREQEFRESALRKAALWGPV
ncbi:D-glycero-alpha-D-manno-heptose-1,7-bisphosphate 7-phosphatase [Arthrobacter sp. NPDC056727]|uniref:D-glycero-alpha-D-manno-heptose-1,7-bisphosphate 7-phosphatase n=1 Tax=Arthrobacter sp. NPDC056727 TaxID=3345927 RepID=UPI00366D9506